MRNQAKGRIDVFMFPFDLITFVLDGWAAL
jgi:hypothetical protein